LWAGAVAYVYPAMTEDGWAVEEWRPLNKVSVGKSTPEAQSWCVQLYLTAMLSGACDILK